MYRTTALLASVTSAALLQAQTAADKGQYHLFHPVPKDQMREMSTDRPDTTESPISVDAGHFQLEASFFDYNRDRSGGELTEGFTYGSINLKAGFTNNTDLQVIFDSYTKERVSGAGVNDSTSGFSDVIVRFKYNFWGNDGGPTAFALMPYVKAPTGTELSNDEWEGGLISIFGFDITESIGSAIMAEVDWVYDDATGDYETEFVHTATVGFGLTDKLGIYTEYVGVIGTAESFDYKALFDLGLTYAVTDNMILDTGIRFGLTGAADDFGCFVGVSYRY